MSREGFNVLLRQRRVTVGDENPPLPSGVVQHPDGRLSWGHIQPVSMPSGPITPPLPHLQRARATQSGVALIIIAAVVTGALIDDSRRRR